MVKRYPLDTSVVCSPSDHLTNRVLGIEKVGVSEFHGLVEYGIGRIDVGVSKNRGGPPKSSIEK